MRRKPARRFGIDLRRQNGNPDGMTDPSSIAPDATPSSPAPRRARLRLFARFRRSEDGATAVEFALISVLLFTLVFAIIQFGLILSFKQDMTRAAAEGARGGAVAYPPTDAAVDAAKRTAEAIREFGQDRFEVADPCTSTAGMSCYVNLVDCVTAELPRAQHVNAPGDPEDCVVVELTYDYADHPIFGDIPLISAFYPEQVAAASVARIND